MTNVLTTEGAYLSRFSGRFHDLQQTPNDTALNPWLKDLQKAAITRIQQLGIPKRNDEEWRFTSVSEIATNRYSWPSVTHAVHPQTVVEVAALATRWFADGLESFGAVILNGQPLVADVLEGLTQQFGGATIHLLTAQGSDGEIDSLASYSPFLGQLASFDQSAFTALNTALFENCVVIQIPRNAVIERPIELLFVGASDSASSPTFVSPRILILAGENSQATIVETYVGLDGSNYTNNVVSEVFVERSAVIDHYKITDESAAATHVATMEIQLEGSSNFSSHNITLGGALVRNDVNAKLNGEHIECTLNGLYLGNGDRVIDNHTAIDHAKPNCNSHEVYKGILTDRSRGVFNGKIFVRLDAQKTDAKQTNKTLLLSPDARIDTKPQLEILADDVKCTHGATVGQLDPNQVFYLRSRGLSESEARNLLTYAFAGDIVQRIKLEDLRAELDARLHSMLP